MEANMLADEYTKEQMFALGLETARHSKWRQYKHEKNIERFKEAYGVLPEVCHQIWIDLRSATGYKKLSKNANPIHLLLALRFLFAYPTEQDLCNFFNIRSKNTIEKWVKVYVGKIKELLQVKMGTLEENDEGYIYFLSIDGTHCPINEPRPFSTDWSSYKYGANQQPIMSLAC